jgi:hypothetical protein
MHGTLPCHPYPIAILQVNWRFSPSKIQRSVVDGLEHHLSKQTFEQLKLLVQLEQANRVEALSLNRPPEG